NPGQWSLARGIEQPLALETVLQLHERESKGAQPAGLEVVDRELEGPARRIDHDPRPRHHLEPLPGLEGQRLSAAAEEHGRELAELVLDGEVEMARRCALHRGQLSGHPHRAHRFRQDVADGSGELRHRQDARPDVRAEHRALAAHSVRCAIVVFWTCPFFRSSRALSSCGSCPTSPSFTSGGTISDVSESGDTSGLASWSFASFGWWRWRR